MQAPEQEVTGKHGKTAITHLLSGVPRVQYPLWVSFFDHPSILSSSDFDTRYDGVNIMVEFKLYYATNRRHVGRDRWNPSSYSTKFSDDGMENLRFGTVSVEVDQNKVNGYLAEKVEDCGHGNGLGLSGYLSKRAKKATIRAYEENIDKEISEASQKVVKRGSDAFFAQLRKDMEQNNDVLIYVHGFNVSWHDAVGAALALQFMQGNSGEKNKDVVVVLFTWPSDGLALPWVSYKSDRSEASGSGAAVGRAMLKMRDFLANLRDRARGSAEVLCGQEIHLLCHSMGNFLLGEVLKRLEEFTPGKTLPRMFDHVFLCAPDLDDTALEPGQPLGTINGLSRHVTLYHNRSDVAMVISDYTKGQPERLGSNGAAHPGTLHNKIHQVDCSDVVHGAVEHSYYLAGTIAGDIRASIDGIAQGDNRRLRQRFGMYDNVWKMRADK